MKIRYAKHISFCDGVARAFDLVRDLAKGEGKAEKRILMLGSLVHNDSVTQQAKSWGVKKITSLRPVRRGDIVIITAHGTGKDIFEAIEKKGAIPFDATCPRVIKVQRLAKVYGDKKYQVIIFGDKEHKEVKGINGWCDKSAWFVKDIGQANQVAGDLKKKKIGKAVLLSQTTQNIQQFKEAARILKKNKKDIVVIDTICRATYDRQKEMKKMAARNDAIIVVGGKESGNTKRLWEIAKATNKNTIWISDLSPSTIKALRQKIKTAKSVGILSGASTPTWEIEKVSQTVSLLRDPGTNGKQNMDRQS